MLWAQLLVLAHNLFSTHSTMAEEPEELLWEDEDAENEEGVEDLLAEEEGAEEQPEEAPQTAEQEQPQPEERGKPSEGWQAPWRCSDTTRGLVQLCQKLLQPG